MICQPYCYLYTNCSRPSSRSTSPCSGNSSRASSFCRPCLPCTPCTPCRPCTPCTPRTPPACVSRQSRREKISDFSVGGCGLGSDSKDKYKSDKKKRTSKDKVEGKGKKKTAKDNTDESKADSKKDNKGKDKDSKDKGDKDKESKERGGKDKGVKDKGGKGKSDKDKEDKGKEGKDQGKKTKKGKEEKDDDSASKKGDKKEEGDTKKDKEKDGSQEKDSKDSDQNKTNGDQGGEVGQDKTSQGLCTPRRRTCLNPLCPSNLRGQQSFQMLQPAGMICYSNQRSSVLRREKPQRCCKCGKKKRPKKQVQQVENPNCVCYHNPNMIENNNFSSVSYPVVQQPQTQSKNSNSPLNCCSSHCSHIITMVTRNNQMLHYHMSDFNL